MRHFHLFQMTHHLSNINKNEWNLPSRKFRFDRTKAKIFVSSFDCTYISSNHFRSGLDLKRFIVLSYTFENIRNSIQSMHQIQFKIEHWFLKLNLKILQWEQTVIVSKAISITTRRFVFPRTRVRFKKVLSPANSDLFINTTNSIFYILFTATTYEETRFSEIQTRNTLDKYFLELVRALLARLQIRFCHPSS